MVLGIVGVLHIWRAADPKKVCLKYDHDPRRKRHLATDRCTRCEDLR